MYGATGTAPALHGTLNVMVVVETATDGQVLSPVQTITVSAFQAIADLQAALASFTQYIEIGAHNGVPVVRFTGVNVQIVDGSGDTEGPTNGRGHLIIGYDNQPRPGGAPMDKTGSHNLVLGDEHTYSSYGGAVVGSRNDITGIYASVVGAHQSTASGPYASVTGGRFNTASSDYASVSGGANNTTSGWTASVTGGVGNTTSFDFTSVSGGQNNTANGDQASVNGGTNNSAQGQAASVLGGVTNFANSQWGTIAGGDGLTNNATSTMLAEGTVNPAD